MSYKNQSRKFRDNENDKKSLSNKYLKDLNDKNNLIKLDYPYSNYINLNLTHLILFVQSFGSSELHKSQASQALKVPQILKAPS